jgi:hypothetical protein
MEPKEIDVEGFIRECQNDLPTPIINHDKEQMFVAIDYGTLEYTVMVHYLQTPEGLTILKSLKIGEQDITIDTLYPSDVRSSGIDMYIDTKCFEKSVKTGSENHDQFGNYRYDFGRNEHSRSPRKRK